MKNIYNKSLKIYYMIGYIILICIGLLLFLWRWFSNFNDSFVIINQEVTSHISNLALSLILYLFMGTLWLMLGMRFRSIILLGIFLIISNFVCEIFFFMLNTPDIIDAIYGTIGVSISFIYLAIINKYGLILISSEE